MTWGDIAAAAVGAAVSWVVFTAFGDALTEAQKVWAGRAKHAVKAAFRKPAALPPGSIGNPIIVVARERDLLVERITAEPASTEFKAIPFPAKFKPVRVHLTASPTDSLPAADVAVMTFTRAEKFTLADVLTPGFHYTGWQEYAKDWDAYEPHLTGRSPARDAKSLGSYALVTIGSKRVLLFGSNLHPATDDATMPLRALWRQIITETGCSLAIDTGTAGGVGSDVVEGDVLLTNACQLNYSKLFGAEPFAKQRLVGPWMPTLTDVQVAQWDALVKPNAGELSKIADRLPKLWLDGDCQSVDWFGFDDATDTYGFRKFDPRTRAEEMDFGALALAAQDLGTQSPRWLSARCASDPQVPHMATMKQEATWANDTYLKFGGAAAIGSVLACWSVVAALQGN